MAYRAGFGADFDIAHGLCGQVGVLAKSGRLSQQFRIRSTLLSQGLPLSELRIPVFRDATDNCRASLNHILLCS